MRVVRKVFAGKVKNKPNESGNTVSVRTKEGTSSLAITCSGSNETRLAARNPDLILSNDITSKNVL